MSMMKQILRRQRKLGESIDEAEGKFKKASAATRKEKYFGTRMKEIQQWWAEFSTNHKAVTTSTETCNEKKAYIAEKYFEKIKEIKDELTKEYIAAAHAKFPNLKLSEGDQEAAAADDNAEEKDETDDEVEIVDDDEEIQQEFETFNSTRMFKLVTDVHKRKATENLFNVRAAMLQDVTLKLSEKHTGPASEIEINFDIEKLKKLLHQFMEAHEQRILIAKDEYEIEGVRLESEDTINSAEQIIFALSEKQWECRQKKTAVSEPPKLQPLKVPKFNGSYQIWTPFANLFTKVVHENEKLNNVQRMQYLLDCLEGEPRRIIQHLDLTEKNYESAIGLLRRRYDDERKIICKYVDAILDHPNVGDDVKGLKSIVDITTESLHAIKNQGITEKRLGGILWLRIIERKLDARTRRFFESTLTEKRKMPTLETYMEFLEERFIGMENIDNDGDRSNNNPKNGNNGKSNGSGPKRNNCGIYNESHRIHQCPKFNGMTAYERGEAVKRAKLCRNCLGTHDTNKCSMSGNCSKCSRFHHISLHFDSKNMDARRERNDKDSAPKMERNMMSCSLRQ